MWLFKLLASAVVMAALVPYATASTNVDIGDETYGILARLEAVGVIKSGLLTTRPISRREVVRLLEEAEKNSNGHGPFIKGLIRKLRREFGDEKGGARYIKPVERVYAGFVYSDQDLNYNNDGDIHENGLNIRPGLISRADLGWFAYRINPELHYSGDYTELVMKKAYAVVDFADLELEIGRDSQWWGPGHHGTLLMSNNAQPLDMVKLSSPSPVLLPWIFSHLGPFRFVFFISKLEEERAVPEPNIWGLRLNFKPAPQVEIGLQRTALFGGDGRSESLGTWWQSLIGRGENRAGVEAGDQRAGIDIKVTVPFESQPAQLYLEAAGEDEVGGLPSKWAFLGGVYLPGIIGERIDLRAEYAVNHVDGNPDVWYSHHIYRSGYTYNGRVIGHHMGTDSRDLFLELSCFLPEINGVARMSYNREEHGLSGDEKPVKDEVAAELKLWFEGGLEVEGRFAVGRIGNTGPDEDIRIVMLKANYVF